MGSSDSDGQGSSRKRSRTSVNSEDAGGGKKARGRPRVDTQDETAADRRRTQIRLAQRAYRQRKETTIASLKDQNDRLQSIIEQMNKSFLQFNDAALKFGLLQLNPQLAQQLKSVTESFVSLAKSAAEGHEDEEDGSEPSEVFSTTHAQTQPTQPQRVDIGWGYSTSSENRTPSHQSPSPPQETRSQNSNNPSLLPDFNSEQAGRSDLVQYRRPMAQGHIFDQGISWANASLDERPSDQPLPFGLVDILSRQEYKPPNHQNPHVYSVSIPTPRATPPMQRLPTPPYLNLTNKTPKPMWTYSHDETTFARRLTRAALETGFHLLSSASQRPAALEFVFKLSLPYMSLHELREKFKMYLARGTDEDLDCWDTPFIHLGGAGTHYPRKDAQGNIVKLPNAWTVRRIGPIDKRMIRAENTDDPNQSHDLNIDLTGFEGEWFDAHDVEGYLEHEKGVRIDPKSSYMDALVDDDEQMLADCGDDYFNLNAPSKAAAVLNRRTSGESDTPSFSTGSSGTDSSSSLSTPNNTSNTGSTTNLNNLFAPSDVPFGLGMGIQTDFNKMPSIDPSTFFDQPLGLDLAPGFDMNLANTPLPTLNFSGQGVNMGGLGMDVAFPNEDPMPVVRQRRKKHVLIDVTKLIDEIIKHGVCLGRAPGFRRKDVDMAFQASLITAF